MSGKLTESRKKKPKISVIIPTCNEEKVLSRLLTILTRDPSLEIIVCDGGSQDATQQICQGFSVRLIEASLGRGTQQNAGVKLATGNIFFFIHADSVLEEEVFSEVYRAVEQGKHWGCCTIRFDINKVFFRSLAWGSTMRVKIFSICFGDQGIFCTKELFEAIGGFPPYPLMEDFVLSKRLRDVQRAYVLSGKITTSSRRFSKNGPWRTLLKMQIIKFLFNMGVAPDRLAIIYRKGFRKAYDTGNSFNE